MPQAEREQQHPKKLFTQGPPNKKKTKSKPNPKLPVRGTSAEAVAEPVTGFWFWFWSWELGNGLRPACLPARHNGIQGMHGQKTKKIREGEGQRERGRKQAELSLPL